MPDVDRGAFWARRAREDAPSATDGPLDHGRAELDAFWAEGPAILADYERGLGFEVRSADALVEIGCGLGRMTRALAARARSVHALDVSGEILERAKALSPELHGVVWLQGDGRTLHGVPDRWADGVFSHAAFQHLPDPALVYGYVAEMGRVLKPGGWAAFQVSDDPSGRPRPRGPRALGRRVLAAAGRRNPAHHPGGVGSAVELPALHEAAAGGGCEILRVAGEGTQSCLVRLRRSAG